MKMFGHPIHMMLIHFPSALFPMDLVCSFLGYYTGNPSFADTAYFALAGGVGFGMLAIVAGVFDLAPVAENKPLSIKKALIHGAINSTVVIAYSILAFRGYQHFPTPVQDGLAILILKGGLLTFMIVGNYLGGSLILKDRVGVQQ
jgi:uncharacterized membrane protein